MTLQYYATRHPAWSWLKARGWVIRPDPSTRGTGAADLAHKAILIRPSAFSSPTIRHQRFVLPHEIWHAVHGEAFNYECGELMDARRIDRRSAVEAVAQACTRDGTWRMAGWIRASIVWHNRNGYRYTWADVRSPEAQAVARRLHAVIHGGT